MPTEVTVIICAHNPRPEYLAQVLSALKAQTLPDDRWELLLIDNGSDQYLSERFDLRWHPLARHIREERLGLTRARIAGIRAACCELLVFVDDDNVLEPDYLEAALDVSNKWSILGAWGGQIHPQFEYPPPDWTKRFWPLLAIRELDDDRWSNLKDQTDTTPSGAGMCVRKRVADRYVSLVGTDKKRMDLDRKGASLTSCGDTDLAYVAYDIGLGTGLFKSLRLNHIIPAGRLDEQYLLRLVRGIAYSGSLLRALRGRKPQKASRSQRLFQYYTRLRLNERERRFHDAVEAGKQAAFDEIAGW